MAEQRVIKVTGRGIVKVKPDVMRLTITLRGGYLAYEDTIRRSNEDAALLRNLLENHGFQRNDIKTLSFNIDTKYEEYQAYDKSRKQRFVGYEYTHVLKIEFASDVNRLGKILYALANAGRIHPVSKLSYTVKDKEAAKNKLLGKAVADARSKAVILTNAAGVALREIKSIEYSWDKVDLEYRPMRDDILLRRSDAKNFTGSYDIDIEPNDIEISDVVTVVWEIG